MRRADLRSIASALALIVSTTQASAQATDDATEQPVGEGQSTIRAIADGDIIVTARKRQESILQVPVIETALPAAQLQRFQVTDLNDVAAQVPGLVLGSAVLAIGTQVSIRGVGTSSLDAGVDQSVSLNLDGLQLSQGLAYKVGTFDLAQAEILKGPQALFFGKNSPGGVISLTTADPGAAFELIGATSYEFYARQTLTDLIVSGPVTDTLGLRLAGRYSHDNGFFRNTAVAAPGFGGATPTHRDVPTESYIIRLTSVWKPSSSFNARLKANLSHDRVDGSGGEGQWISCPDGPTPYLGIPFIGGNEDCHLDRKFNVTWLDPASFPGIRNHGEPFTSITQKFGTLEMNYLPVPRLTLTSVTGYYNLLFNGLINGTEATSSGPTLVADNHFRRHDLTEELRANSDFSGPINFTAGAFYQDGEVRNTIDVIGNGALGLPRTLQAGRHTLRIKAESAFGQLRWKPAPKLEIAGGVRFTHERRSDTVTDVTGNPVPIATPRISSNNWSPELSITYFVTDDLTAFGSLKKGYKSGSFNITTIPAAGVDNSFGDEQVEGGEVGLKGRAFDRDLTFNLAGYYYHYKGLQVGAEEPSGVGLIVLRTLNAGSANVYGVDFDTSYRPPSIEGLAVRAAVNWNHARFGTLTNVPCVGGQTIAQGCNLLPNAAGQFTAQDLSGGRLVRAPTWQLTSGADYELPLARDKRLLLSTQGRYSSKYLTDLLGRSDTYQRGFFQIDANVTLKSANGAWEVAAIGNNLTNKLTTGNCVNFNGQAGTIFGGQLTGTNSVGPAGVDELNCQINRGREVWLRLTLRPMLLR